MLRATVRGLALALVSGISGCASSKPAPSAPPSHIAGEKAVITIHAFGAGSPRVRASNPDVKLRVGQDPEVAGEAVLLVEYPAPTADPAGRDVWCDVEHQNWSSGHAISFRIKPDHAVKLSFSFFDRNRVVYTAWKDLEGGVWQPVTLPFDELRPNPYFQLPDAKTGAPLDVSEVKGVAFAPHDETPGHFVISKLVVER
jgi:hypothetical protein